MNYKRELSDKEFEALSLTKKKLYVANLIVEQSGALPVEGDKPPIAIVMAGVPGAGKTEFLDTFAELLKQMELGKFVRIDLDEIVTIYPGYTPKTDAQFRNQGNVVVSKCVDVAKHGRYNMMIDGTFSGSTGVSVQNIERLLEGGYLVFMFFMHDDIVTSWKYTVAREKFTSRGIDFEGFKKSCAGVIRNVQAAIEKYGNNQNFSIAVVLQKKLRDKDYKIIDERAEIDGILKEGYNIDKLRET